MLVEIIRINKTQNESMIKKSSKYGILLLIIINNFSCSSTVEISEDDILGLWFKDGSIQEKFDIEEYNMTEILYSHGREGGSDSVQGIIERARKLEKGMPEEKVRSILKPVFVGRCLPGLTSKSAYRGRRPYVYYFNDTENDSFFLRGMSSPLRNSDQIRVDMFIPYIMSDYDRKHKYTLGEVPDDLFLTVRVYPDKYDRDTWIYYYIDVKNGRLKPKFMEQVQHQTAKKKPQ